MDKIKVFQRWTAKVDFTTSPSGCWLWKGSKDKKGYGQIRIDGKLYYASSVGWWLYDKGELGTKLHRTCGNTNCVNPKHCFERYAFMPFAPPVLTLEEHQERMNLFLQRIQKHRGQTAPKSLRDDNAKFT